MASQKTQERKKKWDKGNMSGCLRKALHHLGEGGSGDKTWMMMEWADNPKAVLEYRHRIIREEIQEVLARVERIKKVATQPEVLAILSEEFGFGHEDPTS